MQRLLRGLRKAGLQLPQNEKGPCGQRTLIGDCRSPRALTQGRVPLLPAVQSESLAGQWVGSAVTAQVLSEREKSH